MTEEEREEFFKELKFRDKRRDDILEEVRMELKFHGIKLSYIEMTPYDFDQRILIEYTKENTTAVFLAYNILEYYDRNGDVSEVIKLITKYKNFIDNE